MKHLYMKKIAIFLMRMAVLGCLIATILALGGIAEGLAASVWVYAIACIGTVCAMVILVKISNEMERELKRQVSSSKAVPVPYIKRRSNHAIH